MLGLTYGMEKNVKELQFFFTFLPFFAIMYDRKAEKGEASPGERGMERSFPPLGNISCGSRDRIFIRKRDISKARCRSKCMYEFSLCVAPNGAEFFRCEALSPCPHGFSTRRGGVSIHPDTASLNLGLDFSDDEATVRRNLVLLGEAVGFDVATLVSVKQIHSDDVRTVTAAHAGLGYDRTADFCCDGYVTRERGVTLGIRTADCVPILAAAIDDTGEPYVIGAFHAGWRGSVAGIAAKGVRKMLALGARAEHIRIALGPSIGPCCFEIDGRALEIFIDCMGEERTARFVVPSSKRTGYYDADIHGINCAFLQDEGVDFSKIAKAGPCTCCRQDFFYSHRRNGTFRGSHLSVIRLP